jgi:hypothetical protein
LCNVVGAWIEVPRLPDIVICRVNRWMV